MLIVVVLKTETKFPKNMAIMIGKNVFCLLDFLPCFPSSLFFYMSTFTYIR